MSPKPVTMRTIFCYIDRELQKYKKAETKIEKQISFGTNLFLK